MNLPETHTTDRLLNLAAQTRAVNAANGWGLEFSLEVGSNPVTAWALIGTEVNEMLDELSGETERTGADLHGLSPARLEAADGIIRCLDLWSLLILQGASPPGTDETLGQDTGATLPKPRSGVQGRLRVSSATAISLMRRPYAAVQAARKDTAPDIHLPFLRDHIAELCLVLSSCGSDPAQLVKHNIEANRARAWKHGRRY